LDKRQTSPQDIGNKENATPHKKFKSLMNLIKGRDFSLRRRTRVHDGRHYSIGLVGKIIVGDIVHNIRMVDRRSTVLRKRRWWGGMLDKVFLLFMQH